MQQNTAAELLGEHRDFEGARHLVDVDGMSSPRVCQFLNHLVARMDTDESYLEVGTWRGLTLLSAAYGNLDRTCVGCDKFRFWGQFTGWGFAAGRAFRRNVERYRGRCGRIVFHHMTSERMFARGLPPSPVGVYFYDGDHSHGGTVKGIVSATAHLADKCVLLVDDWNDPVIRRATEEALDRARLRALWRRELEGDHSQRGWWNGLGAFFVERA